MEDIQIRRIFLEKDAEEIQRLQQDAPEFKKHYPKHSEWLRMAIREIVAGKRVAFGVYRTTFDGDNPAVSLVGSIILKKETYTHVIQVKNLYIKPTERGKQCGRSLFQVVEQFCVKRGCTTIETEVPYEESRTVNFLNMVGFFVQNLIESPYRRGDRIYRMYKNLPSKYVGDLFDLFDLSCWLFENVYDFRIVGTNEHTVHLVTDFRFEFQPLSAQGAIEIHGSALVFDEPVPISKEAIATFHKDNKRHLLSVIARELSPEARTFCKSHRILALDKKTIEKELRNIFAADLPSFQKEDIRGMIVPVNSKYFGSLKAHTGAKTYFKGGPTGKYLRKSDLLLFYVEESAHFSDGGIRAYSDVETCEMGTPQAIWERYSEKNPIFPRDDFFAWCVDKTEVIALTCSKINLIAPIPYGKIGDEITRSPFDNERLGHFYLNKDEVENFLKNKRDYSGLTNLDKSKVPKIFLSSTIKDLRDERESVIRLIRDSLNYNIFAAEAAGSKQVARSNVLENLGESDIYVCLVGKTYGSEIEVDGLRISATHDEFVYAKNLGKQILVYVKNVADREQKAIDFLREIGAYNTGVKYQEFTTTADLNEHIKLDIANIVSTVLSSK